MACLPELEALMGKPLWPGISQRSMEGLFTILKLSAVCLFYHFRSLNILAKDGEAASRLQALGRDVSVLIQPTDFVAKLKKQLKAHKNYKDYLLI